MQGGSEGAWGIECKVDLRVHGGIECMRASVPLIV